MIFYDKSTIRVKSDGAFPDQRIFQRINQKTDLLFYETNILLSEFQKTDKLLIT